ncbi:MAG: amino acid permease [Planctomycetaceae bacterium]|nr:amino acid permease [Planctomycetaceae bacterium]MBT7919555.1 amino acid permease [Planctomycetaceae bacterium]
MSENNQSPQRTLSAFDGACIIVGIIIGAGIYQTTPMVAANSGSVEWILGIWVLGGCLALVGALCYVELAMTVTQDGGEYAYLVKAYGKGTGSFFAWIEFWIIRPGSTGPMAMLFGAYAYKLFPIFQMALDPLMGEMLYAVLATTALLAVNLFGLRAGKLTQNVLTVLKVLALLILVVGSVIAIGLSPDLIVPTTAETAGSIRGQSFDGLLLAMVLVMFTYGGWNDMSFVATEIKNPAKNIPRALVLGVCAVAVIYLLINIAMLMALGHAGLAASHTPATEMLKVTIGLPAEKIMALLICVTALGAVNGMMFTSARIYHALGNQVSAFSWLGKWNSRLQVPARSLVVQSIVTLAMVIGFGWQVNGFELLVLFVSPFMWSFFVLLGIAMLLFRFQGLVSRDKYRTPLFPMLPLVFVLSSGFIAYRAADYFLLMVESMELLGNRFFMGLSIATVFVVSSGLIVALISRKNDSAGD